MDIIRSGKFTSSEIYYLLSNGKKSGEYGKPFYTYIKKKAQELKLGASLSSGDGGKACKWGSFVENWIMFERADILGLEYTLTPKSTKLMRGNLGKYWAGSKDGLNNNSRAVIDLKCPFTLDSFCDFADCKNIDEVRLYHRDGEKYYWQLVSNSILDNVNNAELIIFVPTFEQVQEIMAYAANGNHDVNDSYFIGNAKDGDLPYITEKSKYHNLVKFEFDIPREDKDLLISRVEVASKILKELTK